MSTSDYFSIFLYRCQIQQLLAADDIETRASSDKS